MELLPDNLRARLPPLRAINDEDEPVVLGRFELPGTALEWFLIAGEPHEDDFVFFGYARGPERFGYFRLSELAALRGPSGQTVVRDESFAEGGLTDTVPAPDL